MLVGFNEVLFDTINIDSQQWTFSHFQSSCGSLSCINSQILDLFIVDFKHWGIYLELFTLFLILDSLEKFLACNRNNAFVLPKADHRIRFAWTRLPICEETAMITLEGIFQNFLPDLVKNILLISIFWSLWLKIAIGFFVKLIERPEGVIKGEFLLRLFVIGLENSRGILHVHNASGFQALFSLIERSDSYCYLDTHSFHKLY